MRINTTIIVNNSKKTNQRMTTQQEVLKFLEDSVIPFVLTGSRYFGIETTDSDWDFFCQNHNDTMNELIRVGFKLEDNPNKAISIYNDSETIYVLYHEQANIHVQLVKDFILKQVVQKFIAENPTYRARLIKSRIMDKRNGDKFNSRKVWEDAFETVKYVLVSISQLGMQRNLFD